MLALQLLSAVITTSGEVDDAGYRLLGHVLRQVKPHHWGGEAARRIAEAVMGHLEAGTAVGYVTLRTELPEFTQVIDQIAAAEGIENIRLGARALEEQGAANDLSILLAAAGRRVSTRVSGASAASLAAQVASELSVLMAGGSNAVSVADIPSLTDHYRRMEQRPRAVVSIYEQLDRHLRWGGLPMSDNDGETILVCARSGHGKTALGIHAAVVVAKAGYKVDYDVIADASALQITERIVHHWQVRLLLQVPGVRRQHAHRPDLFAMRGEGPHPQGEATVLRGVFGVWDLGAVLHQPRVTALGGRAE